MSRHSFYVFCSVTLLAALMGVSMARNLESRGSSDAVSPAPCSQNINCGTCTANSSCSWCYYTESCQAIDKPCQCSGTGRRGSVSGPNAICPQNYATCSTHTNCATCTSDPACGWNAYDQKCYYGDENGACWQSQDNRCSGTASPSFYWKYGANSTCPQNSASCSQYLSCFECAADPACGWNTYQELCVPGDQYGACMQSQDNRCSGTSAPSFYWQFGAQSKCPKHSGGCKTYQSCASCTSDPACGWNTYQGICVGGDKYGACWSSNNNHCSGTASPAFYWQFGGNAVCSMNHQPCSQYASCTTCAADSACGWNVYDQKCYDGDEFGACQSSQNNHCSGTSRQTFYWQRGPAAVCPQRFQTCNQHMSCTECSRDPACGWNAQSKNCVAGDANGACWSSQNPSFNQWWFQHC